MGDRTGIEWTDSTWNPVTGCTKVSSGCDHCYAEALAIKRLRSIYVRRAPVVDGPDNRVNPFAVRLWPERLDQPIRWAEPRMIFVNSMSDLFHRDIPDEFVLAIFEVMLTADWHTYQVLTKRPGRALLGAPPRSPRIDRDPRAHLDGDVRRERCRCLPSWAPPQG